MILRPAAISDARALLALIREVLAEPGVNIPIAPDEFTFTPEEERARIEELATSSRARLLVADEAGELAGELTIRPVATRRALAHVATLGMTVRERWRRRGIGRALLGEALAWATTAGYTRIELNVYARNTAAIALYEQLGFEHEGRRRRFIREGDTYLDDLIMARLL
ncbi:MAG: N-acetyltransferase family protein [Acidobacteriota bacterium]